MQGGLDFIPLELFIFVVTGIFLISLGAGYWVGKTQSLKSDQPKDSTLGTSVGAIFGLLAFMLAFTFGLAATRFETRRALAVEEANAVGTTYLRSGFLDEPNKSEIQRLLKAYVDMRITVTHSNIEYILAKSEEIQDQLWAQAVIIAKQNPNSEMAALFIESLNELIELHAKRVIAALWSRIPLVVWIILGLVTILSMSDLGYQSGLSGKLSLLASLTLILAFTAVIYLIADLDRPSEGLLRVRQQTYLDLQKKMAQKSS